MSYSGRPRFRCPACREPVQPTMWGSVCGHTDTAGRSCEGSGLPWDAVQRTRGYNRTKPAPAPSAKFLEAGRRSGVAANKRRATEVAARRVRQAHMAIRALETHSGKRPARHADYLRALYARIHYPDHNLAQIADEIGVTKHVYSARLRRALEYAQRIEAKAKATA